MLKMKLCLDRLNKNGRLLEHREQWSRSFTLGFIELLYAAHLQPTVAVPSTSVDVDMVNRYLDLDVPSAQAVSIRALNDLLKIGAPNGNGSLISCIFHGTGGLSYMPLVTLLGNDVGIQVGMDNTAVTPTDRRLKQRIGHGRRPADGAPVVFENYVLAEDADFTMAAATTWGAQEFIPKVSHRITSALVKIWKTGAPGDLTLSIKGADVVSGDTPQPVVTNCPDLAVGTILQAAIPGGSPGALTEATFATPADVYAGHRYYVVSRALGSSGGNSVQWRYDNAGATYERAFDPTNPDVFCRRLTSSNSGVTWITTLNSAFMFQEKGQSVGELVVGGCELDNLIFPAGHGSFDIRRYFTNNCGVAISVREAGIHAVAHRGGGASVNLYSCYPFLIARDYQDGAVWVAPIVVADTEILRVVYTPSIAV